jgi:hypothetical protein
MEKVDYKHFVFELISALKAQAEYLKQKRIENEKLNIEEFEGMKLSYHFVMDELISLAKEFHLPLSDYGLEDYDPNRILDI